ncbi:MAG: AAA family ATPase [Syntrophobacterales bacterium]|jgi:chromosome segregation protein|nr:AAA family ATPase [Syntrophobacterales bacterium]
MRLTRLELFGFKSFLSRTVFQFNEGVTSIVGPNGCGKSNVVDAIIWALGERGTKSLRIKDMGDVIFHGSNGKRPVNIAEVDIEFQNRDGAGTSIKRRIYRDGANEYLLNGSVVRLKDVHDFLLGTGIGMNSYAIIEQGKIEYFISMKPQERRIVVEETSGVTRFEEKKREAIVRLEEVSTNLERVEDIHREVSKNFEKAGHEWNRWQEYKVLTDQLNEVDKWILVDGYQKLTRRAGKTGEREADLKKAMDHKEQELAILKEEQDAKEKEFSLIDNAIRQLEVDIKGQEKDMESRLIEIEYLREEKGRLMKEQTQLTAQQADFDARIASCGEEKKGLEAKKAEEEALLGRESAEEARIKEYIVSLKTQIEGFEKKIETERVTLFVSMSKVTEIKNRIVHLERIQDEKKKREERRREEKGRLGERLDDLQEKHGSLKKALEKERGEKVTIAAEEQKALLEKEAALTGFQQKRVRIEQLKGAKRGKEEFVRQMRALQGVKDENLLNRNKLIDMVRVEDGAEKALERFFFKEMEYYVLTEEGAPAIAEAAGKHEGNYIFFPRHGMFGYNNGDVSMAVKWIETVEDALTRIEQGEEGIFINNTVYVDSRGFILREKESGKVDLKSYRERVKAEKELKEIASFLETESSSLRDLEAEHSRSESRVRDARTRREAREKRINGLERDTVAIETELRTVRERLYELETKVEFSEEEGAKPTPEELAAEMTVHTRDKERIEHGMASFRQEMASVKRVHDDTQSRWHQITLDMERKRNLIGGLSEDAARKAREAENLGKEKSRAFAKTMATEARMAECAKKAASLEENYDNLKKAVEGQIKRYEKLKETSGNIHMERHALQESGEGLGKEMARIRSRQESLEKEMLVLMEKRNVIEERLTTMYGLKDIEDVPAPPTSSDLETERDNITGKIERVGEVNFRAEKEYLELQERVDFLKKQMEDLKNAADSLRKTIIKIDNMTKEIFFETFETVNKAFKRFTEMLFKGGRGHLVFNQDMAGIDMYVQPPGKKVARMEQLSGGEKALISLSFLLSLIDTKPSPFVLMDEIDAPLDDANLQSLMNIIREMSAKTQIIFITHNRITMESSNSVYGVTMEEEGISKIISVKL